MNKVLTGKNQNSNEYFFALNTLKLHNNDYTTAKENILKVVLRGGNAVHRPMSRGYSRCFWKPSELLKTPADLVCAYIHRELSFVLHHYIHDPGKSLVTDLCNLMELRLCIFVCLCMHACICINIYILIIY